MQISFNIVLHGLQDLLPVTGSDFNGSQRFRRVAPLNAVSNETDCLYVGSINSWNGYPQSGCVLLAEDDYPIPENLGSNVVVFGDITAEQLVWRLSGFFLKISEWYENMLLAVASQKGVQEILTLSENIIGNFISVSDSALALVAYTKNTLVDDPIIEYLVENGYHSDESYKLFRDGNRFEVWMQSEGLIVSTDRKIGVYDIVSKVFKYDRTYFMHAVMSCNNHPITPGLLELFGILCEVLENIVRNSWNNEKFYSHNYNALIIDLINRADIYDRQAVEKRAEVLGVAPNDEYIVIVAEIDGSKAFPGRIAQDIFSMFPRIHVVHYEKQLLFLLHVKNVANYIESIDMIAKLEEYFKANSMSGGMSDVFQDMLDLRDAYDQAQMALNNNLRERTITHFERVAAKALINTSKESIRLWSKSRCGKILLDLHRSDKEKQQNNVPLLYAYLKNERRARETADEVHMHRNNVVYRINRIEETYGIDLDDPRIRLNLLLSYMIFEQWLKNDI